MRPGKTKDKGKGQKDKRWGGDLCTFVFCTLSFVFRIRRVTHVRSVPHEDRHPTSFHAPPRADGGRRRPRRVARLRVGLGGGASRFPPRSGAATRYAKEGVPPINPATPLLDPLLVLMQVAARTQRTSAWAPTSTSCRCAIRSRWRRMVGSPRRALRRRVSFGVGLGWLEEEFTAVGIDFASRAGRGRGRSARCARCGPRRCRRSAASTSPSSRCASGPSRSQRPHPPILVGGESRRRCGATALRRRAGTASAIRRRARRRIGRRLRALLAKQGRAAVPFDCTVSCGGGGSSPPTPCAASRMRASPVHRSRCAWRRAREADEALGRLADRVLQ